MRTNESNKCFYYSIRNMFLVRGHHQLIHVEYTNDDGIHINYNASIKFEIGSDPT
jgi:hypothetical protein